MSTTSQQYEAVIRSCRELFLRKARDYGTAWRVLRTISIVDQIFIKAQRIRTIQEKKQQRIADDIKGEFQGIINYAIIGLIQLEMPGGAPSGSVTPWARTCPKTSSLTAPAATLSVLGHCRSTQVMTSTSSPV